MEPNGPPGDDAPLTTREAARFDLVRRAVHDDATFERALVHALRLTAETLGVERVGLWRYEAERTRLRCTTLFDLTSGAVGEGEVLDLLRMPAYSTALASRRVIAANDLYADPQTLELSGYGRRHGIGALLDSAVYLAGEPVAVLCHEHVGGTRVWSKQDAHFAATVSDIIGLYLEQREAQSHYRELLQARRALEEHRVMESLGRMAAAVAHDFNNVLAAIGLSAELLQLPDGTERASTQRVASEISGLVGQGARLVRQLLDFAKSEPPPSTTSDVVEVVRGIEPLLRTFDRRGIQLELCLPNEPLLIRLDRARLEQVLVNLCVNARDAMLGGGTLRVTVARSTEPTGDKPPSVQVRVSDTGVGMDEITREHMFEPFFTTKPRGEGEGLGLATVYRIVTASDGELDVRSAPGAGTDFTVRWPLSSESLS